MPRIPALSLLRVALVSLAIVACQSIQPLAESAAPVSAAAEATPAAEAPAAPPAPVVPQPSEFVIPGLTVTLPESWTFGHDPQYPALVLTSPPPEGSPAVQVAPWPFLLDLPLIKVSLFNTAFVGESPNLGELVLRRYLPCNVSSVCALYPESTPEVLEGPALTKFNGMRAAKAVIAATDMPTGKPFTAHVYAIQGDDAIVYVSAPLDDETPLDLIPVVEEILNTLVVGTPLPLREQPREALAAGEVTPGRPVEGELPAPVPDRILEQTWTLNAVGGERYEIRISSADPEFNAVLNVYKADGRSAVGGEHDSGIHVEGEYLLFMPNTDGEYVVGVRAFFGQPGHYMLDVKKLE